MNNIDKTNHKKIANWFDGFEPFKSYNINKQKNIANWIELMS